MDKGKYKIYLRKVDENPFPNIKKIIINESNTFYLKPIEGYHSRNFSLNNSSSHEQLSKQSSDKKLQINNISSINNANKQKINNNNIITANNHQYKPGLPLIKHHFTPFSRPFVTSNYLSKSIEKKVKTEEDNEDYQLMKQKYEVFKNQLSLVKTELKSMNIIIKEKEKEIELITDSFLREKEINVSNMSYMITQQDLITHQREKIHTLQKELNETKVIINQILAKKQNKILIPSLISNENMKAIDYLLKIVLYNKDIQLNEVTNRIEDYIALLPNCIHQEDYYMIISHFITVSKDKDIIRKDYFLNYLKSINKEKNYISRNNMKEEEKQIIINQCKEIDIENKGIVNYNDYKDCLSPLFSQERFDRSIYEMKQKDAHPLFDLYYKIFDNTIEEPIELYSFEDEAKRITNEICDIAIKNYYTSDENRDEFEIEAAVFITENFVSQVFASALAFFNSNSIEYICCP